MYCRDYPDVAAELEDEVVQVGCGHGAQCRELGGCLGVVEYVERPVAGGAAAQVRVMERGAVVGAQGYRRDARGLLERPGQGPLGLANDARVDGARMLEQVDSATAAQLLTPPPGFSLNADVP